MNTRTREILDLIDAELVEGDMTAYELWDILTALRGPDNGSDELKSTSTVPIRRKAFPKFAAQWQWNASIAAFNRNVFTRPTEDFTNCHFVRHINAAADRLELCDGDVP